MRGDGLQATAFWWTGKPNFGDLLAPLLIERFTPITVEWAPASAAQVLSTGSVIEHLPPRWAGIIAGSGKLHERSAVDLGAATVLALRGPLTAATVDGVKGSPVLGDPGLLANDLVSAPKRHQLGIVPHWSDHELEQRRDLLRWDPIIIRPEGDPLDVVRKIASCRKIVASSLHGIIVADAFYIPRRIEMASRLAKEGGTFKFRDHNAALGVPFEIGVTQLAPQRAVEAAQQGLYDVFTHLGRLLAGTVRTW